MNSCLEELRRRFDEASIEYRVEKHPYAITAQHIADLEHVPGHMLAKSVIVSADDRFVLLALPAPHVVDLRALKEELGLKSIRLATEAEFGPLFPDCELGAMPPFPGPLGLEVYLDKGLLGHPEIVFEAGSHAEAVLMRTEDYVWLVQPRILSFGREAVGSKLRSKDG
jgi:Ala-tRNA(Pro) deacylase